MPESKNISKAFRLLRDNLARVIAHRKMTEPAFAKAAGIDQKTMWRVMHGDTEPTCATLSKLAKACDAEPWQLLTPGMQPSNLPMLAAQSERLMDLYKKIETTQEAVAGYLRETGNTESGDL